MCKYLHPPLLHHQLGAQSLHSFGYVELNSPGDRNCAGPPSFVHSLVPLVILHLHEATCTTKQRPNVTANSWGPPSPLPTLIRNSDLLGVDLSQHVGLVRKSAESGKIDDRHQRAEHTDSIFVPPLARRNLQHRFLPLRRILKPNARRHHCLQASDNSISSYLLTQRTSVKHNYSFLTLRFLRAVG